MHIDPLLAPAYSEWLIKPHNPLRWWNECFYLINKLYTFEYCVKKSSFSKFISLKNQLRVIRLKISGILFIY